MPTTIHLAVVSRHARVFVWGRTRGPRMYPIAVLSRSTVHSTTGPKKAENIRERIKREMESRGNELSFFDVLYMVSAQGQRSENRFFLLCLRK